MNRLTNVVMATLVCVFLVGWASTACVDEAQGRIMTVNMDKHQFALRDNTAQPKTFQASKGCVVLVNNQESQLSDLKAGDNVTVIFERQEDTLVAREVRCNR